MCTKLVIAAGVKRVVYIQPYGKSLIEELFPDSVDFDESSNCGKVHFETLKGVTPNGFRLAFRKKHKRKESDGSARQWIPTEAAPSFLSTYPYYVSLEPTKTDQLKAALGLAAKRRKAKG